MNPQEQKAPDEQWQQPAASVNNAPYQAVAETDVNTMEAQADVGTAPMPAEGTMLAQHEEAAPSESEDDTALIKWQSTEYIHQDRSLAWYIALAVITIVLMVVAFVLIKSLTFMILLPVMAVTLVMYVRRPPATNSYFVSRKGIHINDNLYTYDQFRSFGVTNTQGHHTVVLVPRKRFQLGQTIYFPEEVGEKLVDMLAARLPMKEVQPDLIDRILAKLRI